MSTIEFDVHGNLHPYTIISLTNDEFKQEFVTAFPDSTRRSLLFDTFLTHLINFRTTINEEFWVWIGGSFVTRKTNPADIDFVIFLDVDWTVTIAMRSKLFFFVSNATYRANL